MIRQSTFLVTFLVLCIFHSIAPQPVAHCFAQPAIEVANKLPLSTDRKTTQKEMSLETFYSTLRWEGRDYQPDEATRILMQVVTDPTTDTSLRAKALDKLKLPQFGTSLKNTDNIPQLISLYHDLQTRDEKGGLLFCIATSGDPHGLPLFVKVLDNEKDNIVRFCAAYCLATWNVRRGVEELIDFLKCKEHLNRDRTVRDGAADLFRSLNNHKAWGCPEKMIRESLEQRSNLSREEIAVLYIQEIKTWFEANKHRFPDWQPGDPLPESPQIDVTQSPDK